MNARVEHCPGKSSVPLMPVEGGNGARAEAVWGPAARGAPG